MNEINLIFEYTVPVIVGICLCVGYIIKNLVPGKKINRLIPVIMAVIGIIINVWINRGISPRILLGGMFSGLASTGMYEVFVNLINNQEI